MNTFVDVLRTDRLESRHRIHGVAVSADGAVLGDIGDSNFQTYFRSSAKPFQALEVVRSGAFERFGLTEKELAVICSSHSGEDFHIQTVRSILKKIGLTENNLQCGFHPPINEKAREVFFREHRAPSPVYNNCSGKHSGMLAVCQLRNWPIENYMSPEHPVQREILGIISEYSGLPSSEIHLGLDGCGVPVFYLPLIKMAQAYAKFFSETEHANQKIAEAMTKHPEMIGGTNRFDTDFMQAMDGSVVSKGGSEGLECSAILKGKLTVGFAVKVEDGNERASWPALLEFYRQLSLIPEEKLERLSAYRNPPIKNVAGKIVGQIHPNFLISQLVSTG